MGGETRSREKVKDRGSLSKGICKINSVNGGKRPWRRTGTYVRGIAKTQWGGDRGMVKGKMKICVEGGRKLNLHLRGEIKKEREGNGRGGGIEGGPCKPRIATGKQNRSNIRE